MAIFEHVTVWRVSKYVFNLKLWTVGIATCFAANTLYGIVFHQVQGGFFEGLFIIALLNGFLCVCALAGVVGLFAIGTAEDWVLKEVHKKQGSVEHTEA